MDAILYTAHNPEAGLMAEVRRGKGGYIMRLIDTDTDDLMSAHRYSTLDKAIDAAERAVCMQ